MCAAEFCVHLMFSHVIHHLESHLWHLPL
jgi:hypothetical protein